MKATVLGVLVMLAAAFLVGCDLSMEPEQQEGESGSGSTDAGSGGGSGGSGGKGEEAPTLAQRVQDGSLPPVGERLPEEPMTVEPVERAGVYGGTWRTGMLGPDDTSLLNRANGYENLLRYDMGYEEIVPNIARSFEANEDGTEYTFELRKGMKWSDGEPFTSADIEFWYENVASNEELEPLPLWMEGLEIETPDDHTVVFRFPEPDGLFLEYMASSEGDQPTLYPRHYLEQFHEKHNPDAQRLAEEAGFEDWTELFLARVEEWQNPDLPTLNPWEVSRAVGEGNTVELVRNPYYWKTDPNGSQLPYIDRVVYSVVEDPEVLLLNALNGELDMHSRHINTLQNRPVLAENRESGDYRFFTMNPTGMNTMKIFLNLTHQDEGLREVFQNKDFRVALSHAMDRQEVIDVVYQSQGEPYQIAPRPEFELYDEEFAKQYTEHDPDLANELLDRAGYAERDGNGVRLGPDGDPISFNVLVQPDFPDMINALEIITRQWREVGVDASFRVVDEGLYEERAEANEHDAVVDNSFNGTREMLINAVDYFPTDDDAFYALPWHNWWIGEEEDGEEPPEPTRRQFELYDQLRATTDTDEQYEIMARILEISKEQFYNMGVSLPAPGYGIATNDFHNLPEEMIYGSRYPTPGPTMPEQYFIGQ